VKNFLSMLVVDGNVIDGFECILEYMMQCHEKAAREILRGLGVTPKVMNEHDVAAFLEETEIGISKWRDIHAT
jgi:hypothetical protein